MGLVIPVVWRVLRFYLALCLLLVGFRIGVVLFQNADHAFTLEVGLVIVAGL